MDLNKLRYFQVVARTEHVTKAARILGLSQPALTRSLHRLEEELGVKLIVGEGRNIRLSAEGAFLYQQTAPALNALERAEQAVAAFSERTKHTIAICIESASALVVDAIARYSGEHPEVSFTVTQEEDDRLSDIVVSSVSSNASSHGQAFTERIGVAILCSLYPSFPRKIALSDLECEGFICLASTRGFRKRCDGLCRGCGFDPRIIFESDNPSVVRKMIGAGLGVGFWPEHSWGPVEPETTVWLPLDDEGFERTISVDLTSQGIEKRAAQDFRAFLLERFTHVWSETVHGRVE